MISGEPFQPNKDSAATSEHADAAATQDQPDKSAANHSPAAAQSDTIRIKRTYNFAGRVHTEEKVVARDSAEAKLYLASRLDGEVVPTASDASVTKRATKKAFRSVFEPVLDQGPGRTDLNLGLAARIQAGKEAQARKLTTVEKSRMDWAGYVDKEGIKDELELASKSKDSYAARQDFLARSEAIREDDARRARLSMRV
ncbi:swr complex subunit [Claviceps africana]|uniref:SWR1-complex protein 5 n=1 Tax=Claviceps africana TaxID=83212 RepID=A0A8K0NI32_9HYPO|nr:swr complex subunit [Claviceps africana]